jgi:hypothetical protein
MDIYLLKRTLKEFRGTESYHKHLFPGKSPILLTDGCDFVRENCKAYWLFDAILSYQLEKRVKNIPFQIWELRQQKSDLSWLLTCREDSGVKPIVTQRIEFSDFPLDSIRIWVIDGIALLPSEY